MPIRDIPTGLQTPIDQSLVKNDTKIDPPGGDITGDVVVRPPGNLNDPRSLDVLETSSITRAQVDDRLAAFERGNPTIATNPRYLAIKQALLASGPPFRVDTALPRLLQTIRTDPQLQNVPVAEAAPILRALTNEVFGVSIDDQMLRDSQVTRTEYTAYCQYLEADPEQFPWAQADFSRDAYLADLRKEPLADKTVYKDFEQSWRAANPEGSSEDLAKAWLDESETLANMQSKLAEGYPRFKAGVDHHFATNPNEPLQVEAFLQILRKGEGDVGGSMLDVEDDAALVIFAGLMGEKCAASIRDELGKEDGVRFSMDSIWTKIAIALAALSLILLFLPGATAIGIACGLGALALTGIEFGMDAATGHLTDDTDAHGRMLAEPVLDTEQFFAPTRAQHADVTVNTSLAEAPQGVAMAFIQGDGEPMDYRGAETDLAILRGEATPEQRAELYERYGIEASADDLANPARVEELDRVVTDRLHDQLHNRPVINVQGGDPPQTVATELDQIYRNEEGAVVLVSHDQEGRSYTTTLELDRAEIGDQPRAMINTDENAVVTQLLSGSVTVEELRGKIVTIETDQGPTQVVLGDVGFNAGPPADITLRGESVDGRRPVVVRRDGINPVRLNDGTTTSHAVRIGDMTENPQLQAQIEAWFTEHLGVEAKGTITVEEYISFMNDVVAPNPQQLLTGDGMAALGSLSAAFKQQVSNGCVTVGYTGDNTRTTDQLTANHAKAGAPVGHTVSGQMHVQAGPQVFTLNAQGIDTSNNLAFITWTTPEGQTYTAKAHFDRGVKPEILEVYQGRVTPDNEASATAAPPDVTSHLQKHVSEHSRMSSNTVATLELPITTNGTVDYTFRSAIGRDDDEISWFAYSNKPARPMETINRRITTGEPRFKDPVTVAGDVDQVGEDREVSIKARRVTHYVFLGLKILLAIVGFTAGRGGESSGDSGGTSTSSTSPTSPTSPTAPAAPVAPVAAAAPAAPVAPVAASGGGK